MVLPARARISRSPAFKAEVITATLKANYNTLEAGKIARLNLT